MKIGVLFSGGKDSVLSLCKAKQFHDIVCLITLVSNNKESYMFHTPNIELTKIQSEIIGLPLIQKTTRGTKEKELKDLKKILRLAKEKFGIEGVTTGAIRSIYQATRIQRICKELGLFCFNPLWLKDQIEILDELIENDFKIIISGVFAFPLDESFLGKIIDKKTVEKLKEFEDKYDLNAAGEGGEIETTVLDAPFFKKRIEVLDYDISYENYSGVLRIKNVRIVDK